MSALVRVRPIPPEAGLKWRWTLIDRTQLIKGGHTVTKLGAHLAGWKAKRSYERRR
jgi:hypothetical protein